MAAPKPKPKPRGLSEADLELWARYVEQVRPLAGRSPPPVVPPAEPAGPPPLVTQRALPPRPRSRATAAELPVDIPPPGLDRSTWLKLKTGRIAPEKRLDLHGMTAARGHHAVLATLTDAARSGQRCVEIITGRGMGEEGGILRRELPHWLNLPTLRPLILAICYPNAANQGAVRVLLRRAR